MSPALRRLRQNPHPVGQEHRSVPAHSAQAGQDGSRPDQRAEHGVSDAGESTSRPDPLAGRGVGDQAVLVRGRYDVAMEAVQLFGGNGYMAEYRVEQLARDAKSLMIYAGSNEVQVHHIAKGLVAG